MSRLPFLLLLGFTLAGHPLSAAPAPDSTPVSRSAADPQASSSVSPVPTMVPFPEPAPYPSLDPIKTVPSATRPAPVTAAARVWEPIPVQVLALTAHGTVLGLSYERVFMPWFSAQGLVGLHSDNRYNAVAEGFSLRVYPRGHAPRGPYLEAQDDLVQENAASPQGGDYQAQRMGLAVGWQWLLRGEVSVSVAGALYLEQPIYASYPYPSIGSNHDGPPGQAQATLDLSLGWDLF